MTWQGFGFLFSLLVFYLLEQNPGLEVYHWVLRVPGFVSDGPDSNFLEHPRSREKQSVQGAFFSGTDEGSQDSGVPPFLRLFFF